MRDSTIFFLSTAATSASILFIPVIASEMGADNLTIGVITSTYGFMMLLSMYLFGWWSDNRGRLGLIRIGLFSAAITFGLQALVKDYIELMIVRGLCGASIGVFYSSIVTYGFESGKKIGKYTSFESLGWGVGMFTAGVIGIYYKIFILSAVFYLVCFLLSLRLKQGKNKIIKTPMLPVKIIKKNWNIYLPFLMRDTGAYAIWTFFPLYLLGLGADSLWIGIIYMFNTGGQFFIKQYVDKYNYSKLFPIGLLVSGLAFFAYLLPRNHVEVIPIQLIIAFAWSTLSVGAIGMLTQKNVEKASVVGLFSSTRGMAQIIAPIIAGLIMQFAGYTQLMLFSSGLTFTGLILHIIAKRR